VRREKAIYHTLNKLSMDTSRKVLLAEAWCPLAAKPYVHEALRRAAQDSSTQVSTVLQPLVTADPPPTYFKTDKFTSCFQVGCVVGGNACGREEVMDVCGMLDLVLWRAGWDRYMKTGAVCLLFYERRCMLGWVHPRLLKIAGQMD
jgi:hypothetical protein